jgi:hypothetical protein
MTASRIEWHDYLEALRASLPYVHPAGRATIDAWLADMSVAADIGDAATFATLGLLVADKVNQEIEWQRRDAAFTQNRAGRQPAIEKENSR